MVKGYKFGLLYATTGQKTEEEFYLNTQEGPLFNEFKDWLGDTIALRGWTGYTAGLDAVDDRTGTHSLFTNHRDFDIMFHVATMLPFEAGEDMIQQIARKRHLGNDIVLIVFQEVLFLSFFLSIFLSFFLHFSFPL